MNKVYKQNKETVNTMSYSLDARPAEAVISECSTVCRHHQVRNALRVMDTRPKRQLTGATHKRTSRHPCAKMCETHHHATLQQA